MADESSKTRKLSYGSWLSDYSSDKVEVAEFSLPSLWGSEISSGRPNLPSLQIICQTDKISVSNSSDADEPVILAVVPTTEINKGTQEGVNETEPFSLSATLHNTPRSKASLSETENDQIEILENIASQSLEIYEQERNAQVKTEQKWFQTPVADKTGNQSITIETPVTVVTWTPLSTNSPVQTKPQRRNKRGSTMTVKNTISFDESIFNDLDDKYIVDAEEDSGEGFCGSFTKCFGFLLRNK